MDDVESESMAVLLWRSLTQWFGGMGIIVLGIAVLPKLAIGGMQLLGAEAPGPTAEKLTPRIAQTAKALWGIYVLITGLQFGLLSLLGMPPFHALNHALTSTATAGFSTQNTSVGAYSPAIQLVIVFFMFTAGINFALHFHTLRGKPQRLFRDSEFRFYAGLLAVATVLVTADLVIHDRYDDIATAARMAVFQVGSIGTTTGYSTADYDAWPGFSRALLFMLMFIGGCAGSTVGSVKVARVMILFRSLAAELRRMVQPNAVFPVRLGRRAIPDGVVTQVTTFVLLFLAIFAASGLLLTAAGLDPVTAFAAAATCLGNVGPGFGEVGPTHTMSALPDGIKLFLIGLMIVGRLELYTVLVSVYILRNTLRR
jgi:trk system potassium uptake protein TrkH